MNTCSICGNTEGNGQFIAREMMFGFRDEFEYFECGYCGCLQIKKIPENLAKYYPEKYYSYAAPQKQDFLAIYFKKKRAMYGLYGKDIIGMLAAKLKGIPDYYKWFRKAGLNFNSRILDAGCGAGSMLYNMKNEGFNNLLGVEPYIKSDILYKNGLKVVKKDLNAVDGRFDFIILRHSFEHMPDPKGVFGQLSRLLEKGKHLLLQIPVVGTFAWKYYGVNWVQLDAPRHLFLHTAKSIGILATQNGFKVEEIKYDSSDFQFWGSEQYLKDIPLRDERSYLENPAKSVFTPVEIESFRMRAKELNKSNYGDSAVFFLCKN